MQPTKSIAVVLVAFMLTGLTGFLMQTDHEEKTAIHYNYEGDMTPSVTHSAIDDWAEYNPLTNVTGWSGTDIIQPISSVATPYLKDPIVLSYEQSATSSRSAFTDTVRLAQVNRLSGISQVFQDDGSVLMLPPSLLPNPTYDNIEFAYIVGDTVIHLGHYIMWDKAQNTFTKAEYVSGSLVGGDWYWTPSEDPTYQNIAYDNNLYVYSGSSYTGTYVEYTVRGYKPILTDPVYLDGTQFNQIPVGSTATWENGQVNGVIRILCSPNTIINVTNPNYTFSCSDSVGYEYVLWTLDCLNNRYTYQGVTSLTNTLAYTIDDHEYPLTVTGTGNLTRITELTAGTDSTTAPCEIYIDSTIVSVDPSGLLWGNPIMNGWYYYPDSFGEQDMRILFNGFVKYGDTMTINGVTFDIIDGKVKYEYEVEIEGRTETVTEYLPLKGMAVDYKRSGSSWDVSLVFTEYNNYMIDLGTKSNTPYTYNIQIGDMTKEITTTYGNIITASGTWFWQSTMYSIVEVTEDRLFFDLTSGVFGLSMSGAALLMVFFMCICTAVVTRALNLEYTVVDWIVTIGTIGVVLAVGLA